jgi:hypothetical protein
VKYIINNKTFRSTEPVRVCPDSRAKNLRPQSISTHGRGKLIMARSMAGSGSAIFLTVAVRHSANAGWSLHISTNPTLPSQQGVAKNRTKQNPWLGWLGRALARLLHQPSTAGWPAQTAHCPKKKNSRPTRWLGILDTFFYILSYVFFIYYLVY